MNVESPAGAGVPTRTATIQNTKGLHARAAAKLAKLAGSYKADVTVARNGTEVSGESIMGLMMLAASKGTDIVLRARGDQAEEALDAICALIDNKFDEED